MLHDDRCAATSREARAIAEGDDSARACEIRESLLCITRSPAVCYTLNGEHKKARRGGEKIQAKP